VKEVVPELVGECPYAGSQEHELRTPENVSDWADDCMRQD